MRIRAFSIALAALACLSLSSCITSNLKSAWDAATSASVPANVVLIAGNTFDAAETTATKYLVYCKPNPSPVGCNDAAIKRLIPAIRSGRDARNSLKQFFKDHPGELGSKGLYDTLITATGTIKTILAEYNTGSAL